MRLPHPLILMLLGLLLAAPVSGEDAGVQALDRELAALFDKGKVPGAAVAVIRDGEVVLATGYGQADRGAGTAATADTPFRAGSISKSVTALAVMTAVEDGLLDLDAPLRDLLPGLATDNPWEEDAPLRLVHLLEHTTGWPDIPLRVLAADEPGWTTQQGVEYAASSYRSRWAPGRFMLYHNAGPAVAALALERASGQPFEDYVRERVLRPLGLPEADFLLTPALASRIARSYAADGSEVPYQHIVLRPSGSLNASARELARLVQFYLGRGQLDGQRLLGEARIARIERSASTLAAKAGFVDGYGLGVAAFPGPGPGFRGHNGSIDGFTSVFGYSTRLNAGFVLLANGGAGVDFDSPAARRIIDWLQAGRNLPAAAPATPSLTPQRVAGLYRTLTIPSALFRPAIELATLTRVAVEGDGLRIGGHSYTPSGGDSWRRADRELASLAFVEDGAAMYRIGAFSTQIRDPLWRVVLVWTWATVTLGVLLVGLLMLIPWLIAGLRGRLTGRGGAALRLAPLAGVVMLALTALVPIQQFVASGTSAVRSIAEPGPLSLGLLAASLIYPLLALQSLWRARRAHEAPRFIRLYAVAGGLAILAYAAYAAAIGLMPLLTWRL